MPKVCHYVMVSVNPKLRVEDEISESFYMWIRWVKFWSIIHHIL